MAGVTEFNSNAIDTKKAVEKIDEYLVQLQSDDTEPSIGILSTGKHAKIKDNLVEDFDLGIYSEGDDATIEGNVIKNKSTVIAALQLLKTELQKESPEITMITRLMKIISRFAPFISAGLLTFSIIKSAVGM